MQIKFMKNPIKKVETMMFTGVVLIMPLKHLSESPTLKNINNKDLPFFADLISLADQDHEHQVSKEDYFSVGTNISITGGSIQRSDSLFRYE
jgi:hypothetical protein